MKLTQKWLWQLWISLFILTIVLLVYGGYKTVSKRTKPKFFDRRNDFQNSSHGKEKMVNRQKKAKDRIEMEMNLVEQACNMNVMKRHSNTSTVSGFENRKRNLFYCNIPKVGSTYTIYSLNRLLGCVMKDKCLNSVNKPLRSHNLSRGKRLNTFSFMIAREPYARLLSGYENKLYHPNSFWKKLGKSIVKMVRKNPSNQSLKYGHDVTFAELVRYTILSRKIRVPVNPHFSPMYDKCLPCVYKYDIIARLETLKNDFEIIIREIQARHISANQGVLDTNKDILDIGRVKHMNWTMRQYKGLNLNKKDYFTRNWKSYQIRGILSKHIDMPFSDDMIEDVDIETYTSALIDALKRSTNETELKLQRSEALIEAYGTVPMKDLEELREILWNDCEVFGYSHSPRFVFGRNQRDDSTFRYFVK